MGPNFSIQNITMPQSYPSFSPPLSETFYPTTIQETLPHSSQISSIDQHNVIVKRSGSRLYQTKGEVLFIPKSPAFSPSFNETFYVTIIQETLHSLPISSIGKHKVIVKRRPESRFYQNDNGETCIIPKSPAEVVGEKILKPIIDHGVNFFRGCKDYLSYACVQTQNAYRFMDSKLTFPGAKALEIDLNKLINVVGAINDVNQIRETVFDILEDKTGIDLNGNPFVKAVDYIIKLLGTIKDGSNFWDNQVVGELEETAKEKIEKVEEAMKEYKTIGFAMGKVIEINKWLNINYPPALAEGQKQQGLLVNEYAKCLKELEDSENEYNNLLSHKDDVLKLMDYNQIHAKRQEIASKIQGMYDSVKGVLTPELIDQLRLRLSHICEDYLNQKAFQEDARKNMEEIVETVVVIKDKASAFQKALDEAGTWVATVQESCNNLDNASKALAEALQMLEDTKKDQEDKLILYKQYLKIRGKLKDEL